MKKEKKEQGLDATPAPNEGATLLSQQTSASLPQVVGQHSPSGPGQDIAAAGAAQDDESKSFGNKLELETETGETIERRQSEWNALQYELVQRVVAETSRISIEMQALSARVESLSARVDFNDRRVRTLESTPTAD